MNAKTENCCEHCRLETREERLASLDKAVNYYVEHWGDFSDRQNVDLLWRSLRDLIGIIKEEA